MLGGDGTGGRRLLEREGELTRVAECLGEAKDGRGRALVLEGPAGIGKTALLTIGGSEAEEQGFRVLRASGFEFEREFAFGVVRQLFEPVIASASREDLGRLLNGPPERAVRLLGLPRIPDAPGVPQGPAGDPSFAILHGLYWLCVNLSAERPIALVVDDLQWSDSASLRFLAFLLPRLHDMRVLLLTAARPSEAGTNQPLVESLVVATSMEVMKIDPLSVAAVSKAAASVFGTEPEPAFAGICLGVTGGIPFLIWRVLEAVHAEGSAPVTASVPAVRRAGTQSLVRWASQRLRQLGPDALRVARSVAVLECTELRQAAHQAGLGIVEAGEAVALLARAGILNVQPLRFRHPLLRAAVYDEVGPAERSEMHRAAAATLAGSGANVGRIAEHLLLADPRGDTWVVEQLRAAAREASSRGSAESAASYLRRALDEAPVEAEADLFLELGATEFTSGRPGWQEHFEAAVRMAPDDETKIMASAAAAHALGANLQFDTAIEICDRAADQLQGETSETRFLLETLAVALEMSTDSLTNRSPGRIRRLVGRAEDPSAPRFTLSVAAYAMACSNGPASHAAVLARRAVALSQDSTQLVPWALISAIGALYLSDRYGEAQRVADAVVQEARETCNALLLHHGLAARSQLALRRSDLTAAEADARALLDTAGAFPPAHLQLLATSVLVSVLLERGEYEQAERELDRLGPEVEEHSWAGSLLRHVRGRLRFAQHRYAAALADFQGAGAIASACQATGPSFMPWRSDSALAWLALGDPGAARRQAEEEVELAREFGAPRALGIALRRAGLVAGEDEGEHRLLESIEFLDTDDTRLEWSHSLTELGALLCRTNRRYEAREPLRRALDFAQHLGATVLAQRAEIQLRAAGGKPRLVQLTGLETLTASELRVAELAGEGFTNREIAQALFVTAGTVEGHLAQVFQKLQITARIDLPRALKAPAPVMTA